MGSALSEAWFRTEDSGFRTDSGSGFRLDSGSGKFLILDVFGFESTDSRTGITGTDGSGFKTFGKHNQAVDIIVGNIWMVVDELAELGLETSVEETYGVLVSEIIKVPDLIKSIFSIIGIHEVLAELVLEYLIGRQCPAINSSFSYGTELFVPSGGAISHEHTSVEDAVLSGFGDICKSAVSFETDKPVLGAVVSIVAIESIRTETLQEISRD
ncbi:hypothetical protein BGZ59_004161 [Podila verticillata]|nr:hypothetical protein BGZ59_004161 [Podila verticillata]